MSPCSKLDSGSSGLQLSSIEASLDISCSSIRRYFVQNMDSDLTTLFGHETLLQSTDLLSLLVISALSLEVTRMTCCSCELKRLSVPVP